MRTRAVGSGTAGEHADIPFRKRIKRRPQQSIEVLRTSEELGWFIRTERRRAGLTQVDLSDLSGVSVTCISHIENGRTTVEAGKVVRLLWFLGCRLFASRGAVPWIGPTNAEGTNELADDEADAGEVGGAGDAGGTSGRPVASG